MRRSLKLEWHDSPETSDDDLDISFEFFDWFGRRTGMYAGILNFLGRCIRDCHHERTISVLDLCCGRGDLSAAIVRWAKKQKRDVQVLAVDRFGRIVQMARDCHGPKKEIVFDVRDFSDPSFNQAQQFDFVVSAMGLHHLSDTQIVPFLRTVNLLAKCGFIVCDVARDPRALLVAALVSKLWGEEIVRHDAPLSVKRGFTIKELHRYAVAAGIELADIRSIFGVTVQVSSERRLALNPKLSPVPNLLGA